MNTTPNNKDYIDDLILGYLNHRLTEPELAEMLAWIESSEANKLYFNEILDIWKTSDYSHHFFDSISAYQRFRERFILNQKKKPSQYWRFTRWAAIFILAFSLGAISYYFLNNKKQTVNQYTLYVPYGAKTRMELPDKSVVWLNAGSTLKYSQDFGKKNRQLFLEGEGYFEVTKNPANPFIVNTEQISVKVLGTEFNVNAYKEEKQLNVTLLHGSVQMTTIYQPDKVVILAPGQRAVIDKVANTVVVKETEVSQSIGWTQGQLTFDEELFGQIVRRLEREYNVTIDVTKPELNDLHFYGNFKQAQTIEEIFDIMTADKNFHYSKKGNKITVY